MISTEKKNTDILLEVFLNDSTHLSTWKKLLAYDQQPIQFLLSARGLFRLVQQGYVDSSRNFHGLLDSNVIKHPSTFPLLSLFRGEAVIWCYLCALLDLTRPLTSDSKRNYRMCMVGKKEGRGGKRSANTILSFIIILQDWSFKAKPVTCPLRKQKTIPISSETTQVIILS